MTLEYRGPGSSPELKLAQRRWYRSGITKSQLKEYQVLDKYQIDYPKRHPENIQQNTYKYVRDLFAQTENSQVVIQVLRMHQYLTHATVANRVRNFKSDSYEEMGRGQAMGQLQASFHQSGEDILAKIDLPPAKFDEWKRQHVAEVEQEHGVNLTQIHAQMDRIAENNWQVVALAYTQTYNEAAPNPENIARTAILSSAYQALDPDKRTELASSAHTPTQNTNSTTLRR
ncbi:hypothetical protein [Streptomyces sp. NPDC058394]|uniref:hypothetical protein n=1 Tax=Streptomyces sp. NPDC058394 TaxID=3346477 RepID=UPI0036653129